LLAVFLYELIRTAWIGDDAVITLRTVLNLLHGYGPRFNVDERVQAYTHPLWFLLLSGLSWVTGNVFTAAFAASIVLSLAGFFLLCRLAVQARALILAASLLILSKAYVDFATSGLENPLSHVLLLAAFMLAASCEDLKAQFWRIRGFFIVAGLLYLTRPDLALLVVPPAVWVIWRSRHQPLALAVALLAGALPVLCWTAFSLYYYGFPFPNTAYAKLGTGIGRGALLVQGGRYFLHTLKTDPLTLSGIAAGLALAWRQGMTARLFALGALLYLGYVACIGGDFMAGRFFTAPLLVAAIMVARHDWPPVTAWAAGAFVLGLGGVAASSTLLSGRDYSDKTFDAGIADERGYAYQDAGLLTAPQNRFTSPEWRAGQQRRAGLGYALGYISLSSGPAVHWVDLFALADPLLARLPAQFDPNWRIGHFLRQVPTDYLESVRRDQNLLADPRTHDFYDAIRLITRGDLNDPKRWRAILDMNLGRVPPPDWAMYRFQTVERSSWRWIATIPAGQLGRVVDGVAWDAPGAVQFDKAVYVQLPRPAVVRAIDISVDNNDVYELYALQGDHYEKIATINPSPGRGLVRHVVETSPGLQVTDRLMVLGRDGDALYSMGHLVVR
jgi:arabinofuranosyltransferase